MKMNSKSILAIFSIFAMFTSVFTVVPVVPIPTHAACITFGKNPEECRATFPPCQPVTHRQATLETKDEVIACKITFASERCKVIVKH